MIKSVVVSRRLDEVDDANYKICDISMITYESISQLLIAMDIACNDEGKKQYTIAVKDIFIIYEFDNECLGADDYRRVIESVFDVWSSQMVRDVNERKMKLYKEFSL